MEYHMSSEQNSYNYAHVHNPKKKCYAGLVTALVLIALVILALLVATSAYLVLDASGQLPDRFRIDRFLGSESSATMAPIDGELIEQEEIVFNYEPVAEGNLTTESLYELVSRQTVGIIVYSGDTPVTGGSGVIISSEGHIITNDHVVSNGNRYAVSLHDGEVYEASLIGGDVDSDIAVIKLNSPPEGLSAASFGDSDELQGGQNVAVFGSLNGKSIYMAEGIVAGPLRTKESITQDPNHEGHSYIQTTAAINPGNSGGALVDMQGQVVGIVSAKIASVSIEDTGFAIPTAEALPVVESLLEQGFVPGEAELGIHIIPVTMLEIDIPDFDGENGMVLSLIEPYSDLNNYGITPGDIIVSADGIELIETSDLTDLIDTKAVGDTLELVIWKSTTGNYMQITAKLVN